MKIVMAMAANVPGLKKEQTNLVRKCEKVGCARKTTRRCCGSYLGSERLKKSSMAEEGYAWIVYLQSSALECLSE